MCFFKCVGLLLVVFFSINTAQAAGCSCELLPFDEAVDSHTLIFKGRAYYIADKDGVPEVSFTNVEIIKGVRLGTPNVRLNDIEGDPACQAEPMTIGQPYTVFARGTYEDGYTTNLCSMRQYNADSQRITKILAYAAIHDYISMSTEEKAGRDLKDLVGVRAFAQSLLQTYNSEMAARMYTQAIEISKRSVLDVMGLGNALLQLGQNRMALEKFDDVLEVRDDMITAWSGRYRALAQMGRWAELPQGQDRKEPMINLAGIILQNTKISADVSHADFSRAWFSTVDAAGRNFSQSDFKGSRLIHVNFKSADLRGSDFATARLRDVNLENADIRGADFTTADVTAVDFSRAIKDDTTKLPDPEMLKKSQEFDPTLLQPQP